MNVVEFKKDKILSVSCSVSEKNFSEGYNLSNKEVKNLKINTSKSESKSKLLLKKLIS